MKRNEGTIQERKLAERYQRAYEESKAMGDDFEIRDKDRAFDFGSRYSEEGVDMTLIRENLRLTPLQRIRKADKARRDTLRLMSYAPKLREELARRNR